MRVWRKRISAAGVAIMLAGATACSQSQDDRSPSAPQVGFITVNPASVPVSVELGGRTVAYETSEVRPQINGVIRRRLFDEGGFVKAGQQLYQIDPALYRAAVNQAEANLASARASAEAATARAERYKPLADMEAVAKQDYTDAKAQAEMGRAAVNQSAAALETARVNLRYTTIPAPISGRIGRSLFTVGALVTNNQNEPLAVIQRLDPIYVDIQQSSSDLMALRKSMARGNVLPGTAVVRLKLEDGSDYGREGTLQFSEISVDENTGTVTMRARFPNPDRLLLPGMFVKAVFDQAIQPKAYLVPQAAVMRDFDGSAFVYVVGKDDKAERRKIDADRTLGTNWVVTTGLRSGDRIITQGLANVKQGTAVRPVLQTAPQKVGAPPAGSGGASGSSGKSG